MGEGTGSGWIVRMEFVAEVTISFMKPATEEVKHFKQENIEASSRVISDHSQFSLWLRNQLIESLISLIGECLLPVVDQILMPGASPAHRY